MISIVVCHRSMSEDSIHRRNIAATIGEKIPYEYIGIDNGTEPRSLATVYNEGVSRSAGDIIVFVHDDVFFMECGWGQVLERKFMMDPGLGLIGVAGTQYLFNELPLWAIAGPPFIKGRAVHQSRDNSEFALTIFSSDEADAEVVAVDGLFFAIRRNAFDKIRFDDMTFDGFHLYDLDICMQILEAGYRSMVTQGILVKHYSRGNFGSQWKRYAQLFCEKHKNKLPVFCCAEVPVIDPKNLRVGENVDLMGKMSMDILV